MGFARFFFLLFISVSIAHAQRLEFTWPTPDKSWEQGKPASSYLQHAGSGDPASGGYGCVRTAGRQFHEGIDIKPVSRDRQGRPLDDIYAAMDGVVRHINTVAGASSYGRYIVLEHPAVTPGVYTLYAHINSVSAGLKTGTKVRRGQVIARMGNTAGGYTIPMERAHLHFEIGFWVTRNFQSWYDSRKFGSKNTHGVWNGMNLMGFDTEDFLEQFRAKRVNNFEEYFAKLKTPVTVRVASMSVPDFVSRYPALLSKPLPIGLVGGWEIKFDATGIPLAWTPLSSTDVKGMPLNRAVIVSADMAALGTFRCKSLVVMSKGRQTIGRDLQTVLQQLFGWR